jgi:hypothetical protein
MAAIAGPEHGGQAASAPARRGRRPGGGAPDLRHGFARWHGFALWRWIVLLAAAYFLIPLYAAFRFAGWGSFRSVVHQSGFGAALGLSVRLAVITTVITLQA